MNIVIITYNWPPRNAIGTHRPYAWARYWSEAGETVTVLTAQKQTFDEPLDLCLPAIPGVKVVEIPSVGAISLLGKLFKVPGMRWLARKFKVLFGRKSFTADDPRVLWQRAARPFAEDISFEADLVISSYGPASAHLIANDMKTANPNLFWVADYRDLWAQRHASSISEQVRAKSRQIESATVGARADLLSAVSKDMVDQLTSTLGKEVLELPNGFDIDEAAISSAFSERPRRHEGPMRIVYTGMLYEGYRDPTPLLDALVSLQRKGHLRSGDITVDFYGARVDLARRLATDDMYAPFVRVLGHVPREEALLAQRSADVLLLLESPQPEARGVLTGKLFEYIASGRPVLCVGSRPDYEIGSVLKKTGTGCVFGPDEYAALETFMLKTLSGNGLFDSYSADVEEIIKYSRKTQSLNVLKLFKEKLEVLKSES